MERYSIQKPEDDGQISLLATKGGKCQERKLNYSINSKKRDTTSES